MTTNFLFKNLGIYSIQALYNIHINTCLTDAINGRTKKFFKIPGWVLLFILLGSFYYCLIDNLDINSNDCTIILTPIIVCQFRYSISIAFTGIALFWIYLVAISIMMITKNHTHLIRCLLKNIEIDTQIIVALGNHFINQDFNGDDFSPQSDQSKQKKMDNIEKVENINKFKIKNNFSAYNIEIDLGLNKKRLENILQGELFKNCPICWSRLNANNILLSNMIVTNKNNILENVNNCKHFMSTNQILHYYSRILYLLRITSNLLQRWISNFILWTLIW